ncbi:MAG: hypothetical protein E7264_00805 [Lachnospiraceae bacterium]|nr:hypothetical protein [Lachnospiraceae bacterium]
MDFTVFQYITEFPTVIDAQFWADMSIRAYNLGLTLVWFMIFWFMYDVLVATFNKFYRKGRE